MADLSPSIYDLVIYVKIFDYWLKSQRKVDSCRPLGKAIDIPEASIRTAQERLLAQYPVLDFKKPSPTAAEEELYRLASHLLHFHGRLRELADQWREHPIPPTLRVGATAGILFHLMPETAARVIDTCADRFKLDLVLIESVSAVLEEVATGEIDLGFSVRITEEVIARSENRVALASFAKRVKSQTLKKQVDALFVASSETTEWGIDHDQRLELAAVREKLSGTRLFVLPEHRYPELFHQLSPALFGHGLAVVPSYRLILSFVALGLGVAILPGYHAAIKEYNNANEGRRGVRSFPINGIDAIEFAAYWRDTNQRLACEAREVIDTFEELSSI